jgi:hypothetical protein
MVRGQNLRTSLASRMRHRHKQPPAMSRKETLYSKLLPNIGPWAFLTLLDIIDYDQIRSLD